MMRSRILFLSVTVIVAAVTAGQHMTSQINLIQGLLPNTFQSNREKST